MKLGRMGRPQGRVGILGLDLAGGLLARALHGGPNAGARQIKRAGKPSAGVLGDACGHGLA